MRIEEHAQENFDVVICAVSDTYRKEVFDELQRYQVNLLVELAPDIVKTCKIYNKDYHMARFALPNYLKELL